MEVSLLNEQNLEVPPLDAVQTLSYPDQTTFAVRLLLPPPEKRGLIDAIDHPVLRHLTPGPAQQRWKHIHLVDELIA